jgi:hypothetical protein
MRQGPLSTIRRLRTYASYDHLIAGDLNALLHANGLLAIVDQVVAWLERAALGTLIDPSQGWEMEIFCAASSENRRRISSLSSVT